jgi:uncharacterized membrane protein
MSSVESSKTLAGVGALLLFLSFIPLLGIVGLILVLVGMKGLADYYKDESIYKNVMTGVIFGVIGVIAVSVGFFFVVLGGLFSVFTLGASGVVGGLLTLALLLIFVFVFLVLMALYFKRAFDSLAERSGEQLFHTAGTLLFIGAILTIFFLIGLIPIFIAWIIATIAFFSMKTTSTQPYSQQPYSYSPQPTMQATRFCPNCGAPVDQYATFCPRCGRQLPPP